MTKPTLYCSWTHLIIGTITVKPYEIVSWELSHVVIICLLFLIIVTFKSTNVLNILYVLFYTKLKWWTKWWEARQKQDGKLYLEDLGSVQARDWKKGSSRYRSLTPPPSGLPGEHWCNISRQKLIIQLWVTLAT